MTYTGNGTAPRLSPAAARLAVRAMGTSSGFDATLRATATRSYRSTKPLEAPLTIAFGSRDRLLLRRQSRHLNQLPPDLAVAELDGCGHVPMADDPDAVARLIVNAVARAQAVAEGE
jgi:pimeloyl-ACP methyl ester carboxylesterase